jgi:hypothetical protein
MAFPLQVIREAWQRADGRCECDRNYHTHKIDNQRCEELLVWELMDRIGEKGAWKAHHKIPVVNGGHEDLHNCEILCCECHKSAASYGLF